MMFFFWSCHFIPRLLCPCVLFTLFHDPFVLVSTSFRISSDFFFFLFGMIPLLVCSNLLVYLDVPALGTVVYMWRERLCIIHGMVNRFCFRRKSLEFSMSVTLVDLCS